MLDIILNGIGSVGREPTPGLVARQSGRGIGGRVTHDVWQYDLRALQGPYRVCSRKGARHKSGLAASLRLRAKKPHFVQPLFTPGVIGGFYHAEISGTHGPDATETEHVA